MPRVPVYETSQVAPSSFGVGGFDAPQAPVSALQQGVSMMPQPRVMPDIQGEAMRQTGESLSRAGGAMANLAANLADDANRLRVAEAATQAQKIALQLERDPQAGFQSIRGEAAIKRPGDASLADEYTGKLQESLNQIGSRLGNDVQKAAFNEVSQSLITQFYGSALTHQAREFETWGVSVAHEGQKVALESIASHPRDPEAVKQAVKQIARYGQAIAKTTGKPWGKADEVAAISSAHTVGISQLLQENDPASALAYLERATDNGEMTAQDAIKMRAQIKTIQERQTAQTAVDSVMRNLPGLAAQDEAHRSFNVMVGTESAFKQGAVSQKGAAGVAQVMPGTGPEAARLAGLPWDEQRWKSDAEYNYKLGFAYYQKQLVDFNGDMEKAMAAYNAGPNAVKAAVKAHGDDWLSSLPQETQAYVAKNIDGYQSGVGRMQPPTLNEVKTAAVAALGPNPSLDQRKQAELLAEQQYRDTLASSKQENDAAVSGAYDWLIKNQYRITELPYDIRVRLPEAEYQKLTGIAERATKQGAIDTNIKTWAWLHTLDNATLAAFTPDGFITQYKDQLSEGDMKSMLNLIQAAKEKTPEHLELISKNEMVKRAAQQNGILPWKGSPTEKQAKAFAEFESRIDGLVRDKESMDPNGKKASSDDLQKIIQSTLMDKAFISEWGRDPEKTLATMSPNDMEKAYIKVGKEEIRLSAIPATQQAEITQSLRRRGIPVTQQRIAELWVKAGKPK